MLLSFVVAFLFLSCSASARPSNNALNGLDCEPKDGWNIIFVLENPGNKPIATEFLQKVGTIWENGNEPTDAEAEEFFQRFAATLGL